MAKRSATQVARLISVGHMLSRAQRGSTTADYHNSTCDEIIHNFLASSFSPCAVFGAKCRVNVLFNVFAGIVQEVVFYYRQVIGGRNRTVQMKLSVVRVAIIFAFSSKPREKREKRFSIIFTAKTAADWTLRPRATRQAISGKSVVRHDVVIIARGENKVARFSSRALQNESLVRKAKTAAAADAIHILVSLHITSSYRCAFDSFRAQHSLIAAENWLPYERLN